MIIGIGHKQDHGKNTVADMLFQNYQKYRPDLKVVRRSFASKLKDVTHQLYGHLGLRDEAFYETEEGRRLRHVKLSTIDLTPVEIWVKFGTDAVRNNVWNDTWLSYLQHESSKYDVVIVSDLRFLNEAEIVDIKLRVINPRIPNKEGVSADHYLDVYNGWDYTILNDGSLVDLRHSVWIFFSEFVSEFPIGGGGNVVAPH